MKTKLKKEIQIYTDAISDLNAFDLTNKEDCRKIKDYAIEMTKLKIEALKSQLNNTKYLDNYYPKR